MSKLKKVGLGQVKRVIEEGCRVAREKKEGSELKKMEFEWQGGAIFMKLDLAAEVK